MFVCVKQTKSIVFIAVDMRCFRWNTQYLYAIFLFLKTLVKWKRNNVTRKNTWYVLAKVCTPVMLSYTILFELFI